MAPGLNCPHCGKPTAVGAESCPHCGAVLPGAASRTSTPRSTGDDLASPASSKTEERGERDQPTHTPSTPGAQPWLQYDFVGEDDVPFEPEEDDLLNPSLEELAAADVPAAAGRLVSGVQGLLDPIRIAATAETDVLRGAQPETAGQNPDLARTVRLFMGEEQPLAAPSTRMVRAGVSLWIPWIFAVLIAVVGAVVLLQIARPTGEPRTWPGVNAAFDAINRLPSASPVIVFWAYDPASAGEMDLVAAPIMHNLLTRGAQIEVVSLLPNGPATARRLIAAVRTDGSGVGDAALPAATINYRFLPGGAVVLPSLAPVTATLTVILAAQAGDAQTWLELVAPAQGSPVVAGVGAGADPVLRPYLDSGQLVGLVSGFDGAYSYGARARYPQSAAALQRQRIQLVGQNAAAMVIFGLLLVGNLVALLGGRRSHE